MKINNCIRPLISTALLIGFAGMVQASEQRASAWVGVSDFSDGFGKRELVGAEYARVTGYNTFVTNAGVGQRDYGNQASFHGRSISGAFYRNWSDSWSTRTSVATSSNDPVFVNRVYDQDATYTGLKNVALTAGIKRSSYFGGNKSTSWSISGAYYLSHLMLRYKFTRHRLDGVGDADAHVATVRYLDHRGDGRTELILGRGKSIQDYDWSPVVQYGDFKGVTLHRIQPLGKSLRLDAALERGWYDTPVNHYQATTVRLGMGYRW